MEVISGFGYPGTENLYRTQEGIQWKSNENEGPFEGWNGYF